MKLIKYIAFAFLAQIFIAVIVTLDTFGQDKLWIKSEIGNYKLASKVDSKDLTVFAGIPENKGLENLQESHTGVNITDSAKRLQRWR